MSCAFSGFVFSQPSGFNFQALWVVLSGRCFKLAAVGVS